MSRLVPVRSIRIVAFAAAMVVVGWVADRAEATCGGYVYVRGQKLHVSHAAMPVDDAGREVKAPTDGHQALPAGHDAEAPQRTPCNGPTCSNGSFPPAAPVPSEPVSTEHWACSFAYGHSAGHGSTSLLPTSDLDLSEGVGLSIIRPPR